MQLFDAGLDRAPATALKKREFPAGVDLPLGVADMDFPPPEAVVDALQAFVAARDGGYALPAPELMDVVRVWFAQRYDWSVPAEAVSWLPGVVGGMAMVVSLLERPGDLVTLTPIYPPFLRLAEAGGRYLRRVPMIDDSAGWRVDLHSLENACRGAAALLLCNPHNPTGRVFTAEELAAIAAIAERHDLTILSDEIWSDLLIDADARHIPIARLGPDAAARTVSFLAPSKTFNIAGLGFACAVAGAPAWQQRIGRFQQIWHLHSNAVGYAAGLAAYRDGADWLAACRAYLAGNARLLIDRVAALPGLRMHAPEATFVAWIDVRACASGGRDFTARCRRQGLGLRPGEQFGDDGYVRINFACPRRQLEEACDRLARVVADPS